MLRTIKDEIRLWKKWRNNNEIYRRRKGWDHNRPIFGIVSFALQQNWISKKTITILLVFGIELLTLAPLQLLSGNNASIFVSANLTISTFTLLYFEYRVWPQSKLVFMLFLPILFVLALLAIFYTKQIIT